MDLISTLMMEKIAQGVPNKLNLLQVCNIKLFNLRSNGFVFVYLKSLVALSFNPNTIQLGLASIHYVSRI